MKLVVMSEERDQIRLGENEGRREGLMAWVWWPRALRGSRVDLGALVSASLGQLTWLCIMLDFLKR